MDKSEKERKRRRKLLLSIILMKLVYHVLVYTDASPELTKVLENIIDIFKFFI